MAIGCSLVGSMCLGSSPKTVANDRRNLTKTAVFLCQNATLSMCYKDLPEVRCGERRFEGLPVQGLGLRFTRVGHLIAGHNTLGISYPIINRS